MIGTSDMAKLPVYVLAADGVTVPQKQTAGSAGVDLRAREGGSLAPGERGLVPTGLRLALPQGTVADVRPRSGLALKHGVTVLNTPGTIDQDYRGELGVLLINHDQRETFTWKRGDRIAQLVVLPVVDADFREVKGDFGSTERGSGGWGSTGVY